MQDENACKFLPSRLHSIRTLTSFVILTTSMEREIYYPYTALLQDPPILDEGWIGSLLPDLPPYSQAIADAPEAVRHFAIHRLCTD